MTTTAPRGLAVVRSGDNSLHESWALDSKLFDIAISHFGNDTEREFPEATYVHRYKGGKWDGIYDFFKCHPETIGQYDYYWLPDDDILASAQAADQMLLIAQEHKLDLFQLALDEQSYFSHLVTLAMADNKLRYTNFVEIMLPALSKRALEIMLPTLAEAKTGFGLDYLWPQMAERAWPSGNKGSAIIDAFPVTHTRKVVSTHKAVAADTSGPNGLAEMQFVMQKVTGKNPLFRAMKMSVPRMVIYQAIDADGKKITGFKLAWRQITSLLVKQQFTKQRVRKLHSIFYGLTSSIPT